MPSLNNIKEIGGLNYLRSKCETQKYSSYMRATYGYRKTEMILSGPN